jgi:hypothetical protein
MTRIRERVQLDLIFKVNFLTGVEESMKGSIVLAAGMVVILNVSAHAQAVSSGMISTRERRHPVQVAVVRAPVAPHHTRSMIANRRAPEPETTGSIPSKRE